MRVQGTWQTFKQEIKNIGFGAGHSDASWNRELSRMLGISTVPSVVGIVNGRVHHFRGDFSLKGLREFARKLIPARTVAELTRDTFNVSLAKVIAENRVFALFVSTSASSQLTLRYQVPCLQMTHFIKCSYIKPSMLKN